MFEVRIHGRGGQGVVTAAELLAAAACAEGRFAQAFPSFGSERTGAPVVAFCRLADVPIRVREPIARPDALIVFDPTLLRLPEVSAGIGEGTFVLVNSERQIGFGALTQRIAPERLLAVPATSLARRHLGRPLPNVVLLGGFAAFAGQVGLPAVLAAIDERFAGPLASGNAAAARAAFDYVSRELTRMARHVEAG